MPAVFSSFPPEFDAPRCPRNDAGRALHSLVPQASGPLTDWLTRNDSRLTANPCNYAIPNES